MTLMIGQCEAVTETSSRDQLVGAIHAGDVELVRLLAAADVHLAAAPLGGRHGTRTPLHVAADWPGYFPNGPQIVRTLLAAGADPNARDPEPHSESPLHWAASSDDADVAGALIDGGADINLADGSIGTPLERDRVWVLERRAHLGQRGARVETRWVAGAGPARSARGARVSRAPARRRQAVAGVLARLQRRPAP